MQSGGKRSIGEALYFITYYLDLSLLLGGQLVNKIGHMNICEAPVRRVRGCAKVRRK